MGTTRAGSRSEKLPPWWPTAEQKVHADAGCAHPDQCNVAHQRTADWRVIGCSCGWTAPGEDYTAHDRHVAEVSSSAGEPQR
jgi:hypothetical protein